MIKFCHYLTKPIITRIIVSLVLENVIIRFEIIVFCDYLTKPIITQIIVSLVLENVIIRTACIVFRDFMSLVKHDQILSLFNQAYYYTNYCVFSVGKCYYKD